MHPRQFLEDRRSQFIESLAAYCRGDLTHQAAAGAAWDVIASFEASGVESSVPYESGEDTFWAAVWALQHLADDGHSASDSGKRDLRRYLALLNADAPLPDGETGLRPSPPNNRLEPQRHE